MSSEALASDDENSTTSSESSSANSSALEDSDPMLSGASRDDVDRGELEFKAVIGHMPKLRQVGAALAAARSDTSSHILRTAAFVRLIQLYWAKEDNYQELINDQCLDRLYDYEEEWFENPSKTLVTWTLPLKKQQQVFDALVDSKLLFQPNLTEPSYTPSRFVWKLSLDDSNSSSINTSVSNVLWHLYCLEENSENVQFEIDMYEDLMNPGSRELTSHIVFDTPKDREYYMKLKPIMLKYLHSPYRRVLKAAFGANEYGRSFCSRLQHPKHYLYDDYRRMESQYPDRLPTSEFTGKVFTVAYLKTNQGKMDFVRQELCDSLSDSAPYLFETLSELTVLMKRTCHFIQKWLDDSERFAQEFCGKRQGWKSVQEPPPGCTLTASIPVDTLKTSAGGYCTIQSVLGCCSCKRGIKCDGNPLICWTVRQVRSPSNADQDC